MKLFSLPKEMFVMEVGPFQYLAKLEQTGADVKENVLDLASFFCMKRYPHYE